MLESIEIRNSQNQSLVLPLWDPENGYFVTEVEGLDPVRANMVTSNVATVDGDQYQSSRRDKRNVILKLGIESVQDKSVRDLRNSLYAFLMPKTEVNLRFFDTEAIPVGIQGRVETFTAPLFTREPHADVSILCFNPDFQAVDSTVFNGETTSSFEENDLFYDGSVSTGFQFQMDFQRSVDAFVIYQTGGDNILRTMEINYPFVSGDVVKIGTTPGNKSVILNRGGVDQSILYSKSQGSVWGELTPGSNRVRVYAEGAAIDYSITYKSRFGGL